VLINPKGNGHWKADPRSKLYDRKLIESRLRHLKQVKRKNDVNDVIYTLRGGLMRNFGGICDRKLFGHSYIGYRLSVRGGYSESNTDLTMSFILCCSTKALIEEYMEEAVSQLEYIERTSELDQQSKLKFFMDTRQSFGCSALILQGGATFGMYISLC